MDKLKLAHEYALEMAKQGIPLKSCKELGWKYADAMQAEAKEREDKARPDVLLTKDKDGNCLHFHHEFGHKKCMDCGASLEEWQPDWSQAPEWANWWAMDGNGDSYWHSCVDEPFANESIFEIANPQGHTFDAPSFNYRGNWKDSLRKRPEALKSEVDWSQAPNDAIGWMFFDGVSTWLGEDGFLIEDAPSFGFTGSHIMERPNDL